MKNSFSSLTAFILISLSYSFGNTPFFVSIGDTTKKESPANIKLAKNNCYLISGTVGNGGTGGSNAFAMKIDSTGKTIWHSVLAIDSFNQTAGVIETDSSSYLVFGSSYHPKSDTLGYRVDAKTFCYIWITLLDSSGVIVWKKKLMDSLRLEAKLILKKSDGNFVVSTQEYYNGPSAPQFRSRVLTFTQEGQIVSSSVFDLGTRISDMCQLYNNGILFTGAKNCYSWYGDEWLGDLNGLDTTNRGYRGTTGVNVAPTNDQSYFCMAYGWYTSPISTGVKIRTNLKETLFDFGQPPYRDFSPFKGFQLPNNDFSIICNNNNSNDIGLFLLDSQLVPKSFIPFTNLNFMIKGAVKNSENHFACVGVSSLDSTMKFGIIVTDSDETKIGNIMTRNVEGHYLNRIGSFDILGRKFNKNESTSMQLYISKLNNIYNKKLAGKPAFK